MKSVSTAIYSPETQYNKKNDHIYHDYYQKSSQN